MIDQESNLEFPNVTQPNIQVLAQTSSFLFLSFYYSNQLDTLFYNHFSPADNANDFRIAFL